MCTVVAGMYLGDAIGSGLCSKPFKHKSPTDLQALLGLWLIEGSHSWHFAYGGPSLDAWGMLTRGKPKENARSKGFPMGPCYGPR